ncbi:MAG: DUF4097 family beta strand repeat-containing protein [Candidatus Delongbacteria bacterium]|nr:DUF4097 family beta strand repeat-containing protein [Candidatus Delongbacteria bacterium]
MNIKMMMTALLTLCLTAGLSGAVSFSDLTGDGIRKIEVGDENIRQITCRGENINTNIVGTANKNIELYFTKGPMTEDQLRKAVLEPGQGSDSGEMLTVEKKELKIELKKKNKDHKYLTLFTPKDMSIIVTFENGDLSVKNIKGELLLDGKSMDTDINGVSGVINYRNKSGDLKVSDFEGVMDIKTFSGDIDLEKITGSLTVENTSGDFDLKKFDGKFKGSFQVGDIEITSSKFTDAGIENQSGDVSLTDVSGDRLDIKSSLGGIEIKRAEFDMIGAELSAGELELTDVKSDIDFELNLGDISLNDFVLLGKENSDISVNFGEIELGFKDPSLYDFLRSVKDEKIDYKPGMEIDDDVRICGKNKKCLRIDTNLGSITVK